MASQFYGLNISYTGLLASNAALNTTANNIANTDTQGYSRQVVNQVAGNALRTYTTFGCSGSTSLFSASNILSTRSIEASPLGML